jgi:hypothetical protein
MLRRRERGVHLSFAGCARVDPTARAVHSPIERVAAGLIARRTLDADEFRVLVTG